MPLQLRRRNGSVTPFRNSEYLPFYYFIPESILKKCGAELNAIPRNPREIFSNRKVCEFIESDLFLLLIIDAAAYCVRRSERSPRPAKLSSPTAQVEYGQNNPVSVS